MSLIPSRGCGPCGPRSFPPLWRACTDFPPVAPFYWDVYSAEERIKKICDYLWKTINFTESTAEEVEAWGEQIAALQREFEQFKASGFDDYYKAQVEQWVGERTEYVFDTLARQVHFGLSADGYFIAYIPRSWDEIAFDTGHDYSKDTYGRLILRWEADPAERRPAGSQGPEDARR